MIPDVVESLFLIEGKGLFHIVDTIAVDDLETQGATISVAMVLTHLSRNFPLLAQEGLRMRCPV